ncbi:hypothetical protein G7Y89_g10573 [Cudoniella acicularis]|uniref:Uncharacterized protein n=1 Tax=Cudoniella acicularis TaxID=354080 RepID=A0A8H4RG66_9HELO|nr:hypothetical protein G7Y89_g10573 [Cudoniella acicularis]
MLSARIILCLAGAFIASSTVAAQNDHWDPRHWRKNITVYFDADWTTCKMFPDLTPVSPADYGNPWDMVHCWLNNTIDNIDRNFFRTTVGCYVDEQDVGHAKQKYIDIQAGDHGTNDTQPDIHDYTNHIPRCPYVRPYEVWKNGNTTSAVNATLQRCWAAPSLDSPSFAADQWTDHTYCFLDGTAVEGSTLWYESGHTYRGNSTPCYVPKAYIKGDRNAVSQAFIPGGNERCDYLDKTI